MTTRKDLENLLTVGEAAKIMHAHPNTVRRWGDSGIIRSYRLPGRRGDRRFRINDVTRYIKHMLKNQGSLI